MDAELKQHVQSFPAPPIPKDGEVMVPFDGGMTVSGVLQAHAVGIANRKITVLTLCCHALRGSTARLSGEDFADRYRRDLTEPLAAVDNEKGCPEAFLFCRATVSLNAAKRCSAQGQRAYLVAQKAQATTSVGAVTRGISSGALPVGTGAHCRRAPTRS